MLYHYLQWVSQYIVPNLLKYKKPVVIHPCILARKTDNIDIIEKIRSVDLINSSIQNVSIAATEYIAFDIVNNDITFEQFNIPAYKYISSHLAVQNRMRTQNDRFSHASCEIRPL